MNLDNFQSKMILGLYEAAEYPELWHEAIAEIGDFLDGASINFWRFDRSRNVVDQKSDYNYDASYSSVLYETDIITGCRLFRAMSNLPEKGLFHWSEISEFDDLLNSILWNEWVSKTETFPHNTARLPIGKDVSFQLNTAYRNGFRVLDVSERLKWTELILPHLWQALKLEEKIFGSEEQSDSDCVVLNRVSGTLLLLSTDGCVVERNDSAEDILAQNDGLSLHRNQLVCALSDEQAELTRLIAEAGQTGIGRVAGAGGFLSISRPSLKRPYHIAVYPLLNGQKYHSGPKPPRILVLIDDPEQRPEAPPQVLRRLYGISQAQSRVMVLLLKGLTQEQIADELRLSKNTIKTHERDIFQRLDVRSRSDLIRLVLPGLGSLQI